MVGLCIGVFASLAGLWLLAPSLESMRHYEMFGGLIAVASLGTLVSMALCHVGVREGASRRLCIWGRVTALAWLLVDLTVVEIRNGEPGKMIVGVLMMTVLIGPFALVVFLGLVMLFRRG